MTEPVDLEIHEVTTGVSLSTGTPPTTERIEHLQRTEPTDIEIHEVIIDVSPSTETSSTTESITPFVPERK